MKPVIMLAGPTASGKTDTAIKIAKAVNGEIVNMDSMQIYQDMNIGTASPTLEELLAVPHHLFSFVPPNEAYSVAQYKKDAMDTIHRLHGEGKVPIFVGGTGLYLNSIYYDLDFESGQANLSYRKELEDLLEQLGPHGLHDHLASFSKEQADKIHPNNTRKVMRALEIIKNGETPKDYRSNLKVSSQYRFYLIGLTMNRDLLYERINKRVELMLKDGLVDEVKNVINNYQVDDTFQSMKGIGYKEIVPYLEGHQTLEEATMLLKRNSRRYAKRQLTWFNNQYDQMHWTDFGSLAEVTKQQEEIVQDCLTFLSEDD